MVTYYPPVTHAVPDVSGLSAFEQIPRPPPPVKINGVVLAGDMTSEQLHLASADDMKAARDAIEGLAEDKQDKLTFDDVPTEDSDNPVKSGGVYVGLADKASKTETNLTPVYGGNGNEFSDWTYAGLLEGESVVEINYSVDEQHWTLVTTYDESVKYGPEDATSLAFDFDNETRFVTATRTANPVIGYVLGPNDPNAGNQNYGKNLQRQLSTEQIANIDAVPGKADEDDLPYALVTPGEWKFNQDGGFSVTETYEETPEPHYFYMLKRNGSGIGGVGSTTQLLVIDWNEYAEGLISYRDSLPGNLRDRAVNSVTASAATTLTLPAATAGTARDFLVRLTVSSSSAITFSAQTGETATWDAMGDPSSTFAAGTYLYRITEVADGVFHAEDMLALAGLEAALAEINGGVAS